MNERLKYLFDVYQKNIASEKEVEELLDLLNSESKDNIDLLLQEYNEQYQNDDPFFTPSTSQKILANILSDESKHKNNPYIRPIYHHSFKKYLIAAIFLITCGLGLVFLINNEVFNGLKNKKITSNKVDGIQPGGNKAVLKLADGSVIVLDNAKNGLLRDQKNVSITKTAQGQLVFQVKNSSRDENSALLNTIETPKGGQYQVILPDQTIVWLNAASSIQFPTAFYGKQRKVKITGEVYFEVAKNAAMPFIVESRNAQIEVLGTHFNVMDYEDEKIAKTTLLEGAVKILNQQQSEVLKPGQQATYGEHTQLKLENVADPYKEIAWKNGFFEFQDSSIDAIMRQVARWYDVKVIFDGPIPANEFTGKISRNINLGEFLKILSFAGFDFTVEGQNVIVVR